MGKSGIFDTDTGELAPHAGEFLAGVLALSRISRVTVALESGHNAGAALLAAARMTGRAETCLLFDRWSSDPLTALSAALQQTDHNGDFPAGASLTQGLHAMQTRRQQSFLIIFDHFEEYLDQNADPARSADFDQVFIQLATDSELDVHLLLVLDEAAEQMLGRFQEEIPGIGDGCLRMPAGAMTDLQGSAPARRDRSFGMLLERLTARAPADEGAADQIREDQPATALEPIEEQAAIQDAPPVPEALAAAPQTASVITPAVVFDQPAAPPPVPAEPPPPPQSNPDTPPRRPRKALTAALAALLAVGIAVFAYRQQAPRATPAATPAPATAAQGASPAPVVTAQPQQPANPAPPLIPAPATAAAEPRPDATAPATSATSAASAAPPAAGAVVPVRGTPTVYIHVRSQRERERLQALARTLSAKGIRVVDVKVMNKGPSVTDLRYFRDEDREQALTVQKALAAAGVPVPRLSRMNGFENTTRPHQFEVWLSDESRPAPARR